MRWNYLQPDHVATERLQAEGKLDPILARLLALRGIKTMEEASAFLSPFLDQLHSPYLMRGMREAVERVSAAIVNKEQILIYGDYDVDGTTAVGILRPRNHTGGGPPAR